MVCSFIIFVYKKFNVMIREYFKIVGEELLLFVV